MLERVDDQGQIHHSNPLVDFRLDPSLVEDPEKLCRDGGPGSDSRTECPYGTQPTRCPGARYVEYYSIVQHAEELSNWDGHVDPFQHRHSDAATLAAGGRRLFKCPRTKEHA